MPMRPWCITMKPFTLATRGIDLSFSMLVLAGWIRLTVPATATPAEESPAPASATSPSLAGAKKLLIFGDPNPRNPPWQKDLMENSLLRISTAFKRQGYEIDLIRTSELNAAVVREHLARHARSLTPNDTFVMYSHSHGGPRGTFFLNWTEFADAILAIPARNVVVFAMSCRSGALTDTLATMKPKWEDRGGLGRSLVVLTPVAADQDAGPSPEPGVGNPFTYAIATAVEGAADGSLGTERNGRIEMRELVDYVIKTTREKSRGRDYQPQFAGIYPPDAVFVPTTK
jgi:hypothetical protein